RPPDRRAPEASEGAPRRLPGPNDLVGRRALDGREARLANQRHDLLDGDGVDVVGRPVDVLLEERAPPVVSSEVERDLAGALALREPRRLDVRAVVEVEARGREHAQI